jgi:hypothetical protein
MALEKLELFCENEASVGYLMKKTLSGFYRKGFRMSRPMALGLVLLVLILTSQSDWKREAKVDLEGTSVTVSKQQQLQSNHEKVNKQVSILSQFILVAYNPVKEKLHCMGGQQNRKLIMACIQKANLALVETTAKWGGGFGSSPAYIIILTKSDLISI